MPLRIVLRSMIGTSVLLRRAKPSEQSRHGSWMPRGVSMLFTMLDLMREYRVPSLSVHDSLIVPASKADIAAQRLARRFHWVTQVQPLLKINQPPLLNAEVQGTKKSDAKRNTGTKGWRGPKNQRDNRSGR
jgi:hypothetical protein